MEMPRYHGIYSLAIILPDIVLADELVDDSQFDSSKVETSVRHRVRKFQNSKVIYHMHAT